MKKLKIAGISVLSAVLLFVVTSELRQSLPANMKDYVVEAGRQNFRPNESILPRIAAKGMEVYAVFDSSSWWSIDDWNGDRDYYDWNKLKGLTAYWSTNNRQTAMFAWRPDSTAYTIQVTAYTNDKKGGWTAGPPVRVRCGDLFTGIINWTSRKASYQYGEESVIHDLRRPYVTRETGTWIGGGNNSEGPYGGQAHKEMKVSVETRIR